MHKHDKTELNIVKVFHGRLSWHGNIQYNKTDTTCTCMYYACF